ncbi:MAG: electron transport complex subunit RsxG [Cocleimonas sp.]|nr:electron transport complex subunit RsxG [Cocleimonas sp.]
MKRLFSAMRKSSLLLGFYALIGVLFVSTVNLVTRDQIAENQRMALQQKWNEVLNASLYANDLNKDNKMISAEAIGLPYEAKVYLARSKEGQPIAAIFNVTTLQGYSGAITLLVAVNYSDQHLTGVRVVKHKETPGLGDKIEVAKDDWILGFNDKFLTDPSAKSWAVKRDGGEFDQFTGATITPRAIVDLVEDVLIYAHHNMQRLFKEPINNTGDNK